MFKFSNNNKINFVDLYKKTEDFINEIPVVKQRRKRRKFLKFLKYFCFSILGFFLFLFIIIGSSFLTLRQNFNLALEGKNNLEKAVDYIKLADFNNAFIFSKKAEENFYESSLNLNKIKNFYLIKRTEIFKKQYNNLEFLIKTAEILSRTINQGSVIGEEFNKLIKKNETGDFSKLTTEEKRNILKLIYESGPEINGVKANLDLALLNLNQIKFNGIFIFLKDKINNYKEKLQFGSDILSKAIPAMNIIPAIAGYPSEAKYLFILQNNDELRPTGGFIGTYGIMNSANGDILNFETHDIYHLDMPVKDKLNITPPDPLKKYLGVDKWFMRDANWSPDWPSSAQKVEWFYFQETGNKEKDFNGVIAITPDFIHDLLELIGPITIENEEYSKNNFTELLEYRVEKGYVQLGVSSWNRKEVIGDILSEIKIKLFNLPSTRWGDVLKIINSNILKKNILIYFKDSHLQDSVELVGLGGEIKKTDDDYFMVVDANMAAFKTDSVMNKGIEYSVEQNIIGVFSKLKINYLNLGEFNWRTTRYRTYTRIYVPKGSELIEIEGIDDDEIEVGEEFDKTYFGVFISVEPGDMKNLIVKYKLPERINNNIKDGFYSLYVQKQPGNNIKELKVDVNPLNSVKSYNPIGFSVDNVNYERIIWKTDFNFDKRFEIEL